MLTADAASNCYYARHSTGTEKSLNVLILSNRYSFVELADSAHNLGVVFNTTVSFLNYYQWDL